MKKLATILILLAIAAAAGYYYLEYGKPKEKPTVVQASVSRGDVTEVVSATGTLEAVRTVQVGSQVSGTVKELYTDFNKIVKQGQKIAELDDSLLKVQVQIQEANIAQRNTDIANQQVQLEDSQRQLDRQKDLFNHGGLVTRQAVEQAELTVKSRIASIASARSQLVSAEASLAQAKLNVDYCTIYSPIDGVVVDRKVDRGQTVQSSVNVAQFFTIATDLTTLKLSAGVDESEIGKVRMGMPVTFTVDSYPQTTFNGQVSTVRLNATTANNVVTYPVWIDVNNGDLKLKPSMTTNLRIIVSTATDVLRVPSGALRFKPNGDMYTALGLQAPTPGQGRAGRNGGAPGTGAPGAPGDPAGAAAPGTTPGGAPAVTTPAAGGATPPAAGAPGTGAAGRDARRQGGQGGQGTAGNQTAANQGGGRGFGAGSNMSDADRQRMMQQFAQGRGNRTGGRGGQGAGGANAQRGNNGRGGRQAGNAGGNTTPITERNADQIDELFAPMPKVNQANQVWTWDEATKTLKSVQIRTGVSDGQFAEVISGDLQVGQLLVTSIIVPQPKTAPGQPSNLFGQPNRGGGQGLTPGGGGNQGGGAGGGRGGGGGGGGRGGN